ncbi:olfactory receptor 2AT4-like [Erpetoichthys calabaricus]|uniref:olfactory receptor 2AT4-like n=1 Tax=Erpetoichthys calabaricus TaxID=27687 RepID=UPI002234E852|nr:olfactory receptor 2AT4-like [Erpetoichthys calabaricus]
MNQTGSPVQEFVLAGIPGFGDEESRRIFFAVFLTAYLFILLWNFLLIFIFSSDKSLHTPMYVLVCGLAILDIVLATNIIPGILVLFRFGSRSVSFTACFTQMFFFFSLFFSESFLLGLMAYDRYIAICHPLHYPNLMDNTRILKLMVGCWLTACLCSTIIVALTLRFPFCGPNKIVQCVCDFSSVLSLACGNILTTSYIGLTIALSVLAFPMMYIVFSYVKIISSVLKIATSEGRMKAFYTCGTHMLVISIFYFVASAVIISYRIPGTSVDMRIIGILFHNIFPTLTNPVIYCLRTKEIRDSLFKTLKKGRILPKSL